MDNHTKLSEVAVTVFDSEATVKSRIMVSGRPVVANKEGSEIMQPPAPAPLDGRRDGGQHAVTFMFAMMLAAIVVVLCVPPPRAQLVVPLVAGMPALLTAVLGWRCRR